MQNADFDLYRQLYAPALADIWDKLTFVLVERGVAASEAEAAALHITEWIRTTWGSLILVERHLGDPRPRGGDPQPQDDGPLLFAVPAVAGDPLVGSRFATLRDHAVTVLARLAPAMTNPTAAALEIVATVRRDYRGSYIPRVKKIDQIQRNQRIWRQATSPAKVEALAIEHGISVVRAYQINKEMQDRRDKRDQLVLPF